MSIRKSLKKYDFHSDYDIMKMVKKTAGKSAEKSSESAEKISESENMKDFKLSERQKQILLNMEKYLFQIQHKHFHHQ